MYFTKKKDHLINMIQTWNVDINIKKRQQIHEHVSLDKLHYPTIVLYFQDKLFRYTYLLIVLFILEIIKRKRCGCPLYDLTTTNNFKTQSTFTS